MLQEQKLNFPEAVSGMSLIEILVAVLILAVFLTPLLPQFTEINRQNIDAQNWIISTSLGTNKMESLLFSEDPRKIQGLETKEIHGTLFEIESQVIFMEKALGLEEARPEVSCFRLKVLVRWKIPGNQPGNQSGKHEIKFHRLLFRTS